MSDILTCLTILLYASTVITMVVMAYLAFLGCVAVTYTFQRWMRQVF